MSQTVFSNEKVIITRYCGAGETSGPHRLRWQVLSLSNEGLTAQELRDLRDTLTRELVALNRYARKRPT